MTIPQRCVRRLVQVVLRCFSDQPPKNVTNLDETSGDNSCGCDLLKLQTFPTTAFIFETSVGNFDKQPKCQLTAYGKTSNSGKQVNDWKMSS